MVLLGWLLGLLCLSGLSLMDGSPGDNSYGFRTCVAQCRENFDCPVAAHDYKWTTNHCFRCRYACMWRSVDDFGSSPPQFFGKWPFIAWWIEFFGRFYVVQEPASAIFSVMNLAAVYIMFRRVKQGVSKRNRMRKVWLGYSIVGMAAWVASTFFHSVDFWFSEMLDYFAACALIVYALFASITFVLKLFQRSFAGRILWLILGISMLLFYLNHITYLWAFFDYGYNMKCCVLCSVLTALIYIAWMANEYTKGRWRPSTKILSKVILWSIGALAFELLDFAPLFWTFDAHSLFHLATVPVPMWLAEFVILEGQYEGDNDMFKYVKQV